MCFEPNVSDTGYSQVVPTANNKCMCPSTRALDSVCVCQSIDHTKVSTECTGTDTPVKATGIMSCPCKKKLIYM